MECSLSETPSFLLNRGRFYFFDHAIDVLDQLSGIALENPTKQQIGIMCKDDFKVKDSFRDFSHQTHLCSLITVTAYSVQG